MSGEIRVPPPLPPLPRSWGARSIPVESDTQTDAMAHAVIPNSPVPYDVAPRGYLASVPADAQRPMNIVHVHNAAIAESASTSDGPSAQSDDAPVIVEATRDSDSDSSPDTHADVDSPVHVEIPTGTTLDENSDAESSAMAAADDSTVGTGKATVQTLETPSSAVVPRASGDMPKAMPGELLPSELHTGACSWVEVPAPVPNKLSRPLMHWKTLAKGIRSRMYSAESYRARMKATQTKDAADDAEFNDEEDEEEEEEEDDDWEVEDKEVGDGSCVLTMAVIMIGIVGVMCSMVLYMHTMRDVLEHENSMIAGLVADVARLNSTFHTMSAETHAFDDAVALSMRRLTTRALEAPEPAAHQCANALSFRKVGRGDRVAIDDSRAMLGPLEYMSNADCTQFLLVTKDCELGLYRRSYSYTWVSGAHTSLRVESCAAELLTSKATGMIELRLCHLELGDCRTMFSFPNIPSEPRRFLVFDPELSPPFKLI